MTIAQVAQAFAAGRAGRCHNAKTDGCTYWLHGNAIAWRHDAGVTGCWASHHTATTANHLRHIARALGVPGPGGYAKARNEGVREFTFA